MPSVHAQLRNLFSHSSRGDLQFIMDMLWRKSIAITPSRIVGGNIDGNELIFRKVIAILLSPSISYPNFISVHFSKGTTVA